MTSLYRPVLKTGLAPKTRIVRNSARCLDCGTEIESKHRNDFQTCACGNISVDGGQDYIRRVFSEGSGYEDTSIEEPVDG